jgi:hypothetical protein
MFENVTFAVTICTRFLKGALGGRHYFFANTNAITFLHLRFQNSKFECDFFALFEIFWVYIGANIISKETVTA